MDTSKEYIAMCREAKEIQEAFKNEKYRVSGQGHQIAWRYREEDRYYFEILERRMDINPREWILFYPGEGFGSHTPEKYRKFEGEWLWLPRQDQLQEMIFSMNNGKQLGVIFMDMIVHLNFENEVESCSIKFNQGMIFQYKSIEMCLLVILMYLLGKRWNGETWVKRED